MLGFSFDESSVPEDVTSLANERWQAKQNKDYAKADAIRAEIFAKGYVVKDSKDGFVIEKA